MSILDKAEYLHVGRRLGLCAGCGASLLEKERHPSVLIEQEAAEQFEGAVENKEQQIESEQTKEEAPKGPSAAKPAAEEDEAPFTRLDFCSECWQAMKDRAYFSFWIGKPGERDRPKRKLNRAERDVALTALFDSLGERDGEEEDFKPHLFFLAHLLMKFKVFKWLPGGEDDETGEPVVRFRRADTGEEVLVPEMEMPDEMIVRIKNDVENYLEESTGQKVPL